MKQIRKFQVNILIFEILIFGSVLSIVSKGITNKPLGSQLSLGNFEQLDDEGLVLLAWEVDLVKEIITFELEANTLGYVGFGISPQGSMKGADIFIAGVHPNGTAYYSDRFGIGFTEPKIDDHQDWFLLAANESKNSTYLKFYRALYTCDDEDYPITNDTNRLIWAMGGTDTIEYHTSARRGSRSVHLTGAPIPDINLDEMLSWEMRVDMEMPKDPTAYWCSFHIAPILSKKHQIVAFNSFLDNSNAQKYTHHFILYNCFLPANSTGDIDKIFQNKTVGEGNDGDYCYGTGSKNIPNQYCKEYLYVWAKGGKIMVFPENVGYPIGTGADAGKQQYYMMEIHYDNPEQLQGIKFKTGVEVYYTDKLRPIDAGLMTIGYEVDATLTVPPKTEDYLVVGHCSSQCTDLLPSKGLTVFNALLHSHISGRKLKLRHFRGNVELPWMDFDDHYDFDYQQNKPFNEVRKILPGDQLSYECTYDSTWKKGKVVSGGFTTNDEMCQSFLWYYPKVNYDHCGSRYPVQQHFNEFGVTSYYKNNSLSVPIFIINSPPSLAGDYDDSISYKFNWTAEFQAKYTNNHRFGGHLGNCRSSRSGTSFTIPNTTYPTNTVDYIPEDKCAKK